MISLTHLRHFWGKNLLLEATHHRVLYNGSAYGNTSPLLPLIAREIVDDLGLVAPAALELDDVLGAANHARDKGHCRGIEFEAVLLHFLADVVEAGRVEGVGAFGFQAGVAFDPGVHWSVVPKEGRERLVLTA